MIKVPGKPHFKLARGIWRMYTNFGIVGVGDSLALAYENYIKYLNVYKLGFRYRDNLK